MELSENDFNYYKLWFDIQLVFAERSNTLEITVDNLYTSMQDNIVKVAALVTMLNHKCWDYYDNGDEEASKLYADLYYKYNDKAWDWLEANGTEEEKDWYFHTMD